VRGGRTASTTRPRLDLRANASAALAAVLLGASVVAARVAVREVPPLSLAVLRFGQAFLLLAGAMLVLAPDRLRVARRRLPLLALLGAVYFAAFPVTFNTGLRFTEASRGALMLASMPIWSALLGRVVGERLDRRQLAGVGMSVVGIGLAFAEPGWAAGGGTALLGDGLLLLTGLLGAVYGLLAKRALTVHGPATVTAYAMLFGTLLVLPWALLEGLAPAVGRLDGRVLAAVLFLGVPGGAVAFLL
jgi:drug/metabolite transporter (DMT)-like permease